MSKKEPQTIEEAKMYGYKIFSRKKGAANFKSDPAHAAAPVVNCDGTTIGKKCAESPCLGGIKNIYFCSSDGGCDDYIQAQCSGG